MADKPETKLLKDHKRDYRGRSLANVASNLFAQFGNNKEYYIKQRLPAKEMSLNAEVILRKKNLFAGQNITIPKSLVTIINSNGSLEERRMMIQNCKSYLDLQLGPRYKKGQVVKYTLLGSPVNHEKIKK